MLWRSVSRIHGVIPDNIFELQFHTEQSLEVKEGDLHMLYEKHRVETDIEKIAMYQREMINISNKITDPKNIEQIKEFH